MKIYENGSLSLLAFQFCTQLREPSQGQTCGPGYLSHPSFPTLQLRYQSRVAKEANSPSLPAEGGNGQWLWAAPPSFCLGLKTVESRRPWLRESSLKTFPAENPSVTFLCLPDKIQSSHHDPWGLFPPGLPVTQAEVCACLWPSLKFCALQYQAPAIQPIWQDLRLVPAAFPIIPIRSSSWRSFPDHSLYTRVHDYKFGF